MTRAAAAHIKATIESWPLDSLQSFALIMVGSLCAACAGQDLDPFDEPHQARAEQEMYGSLVIDGSCSAAEKDVIGAAWIKGMRWADSQPYEVCVRRHVRSHFVPCQNLDPWRDQPLSVQAAKLLAITRGTNTNRIEVRCKDIPGGNGSVDSQYRYGYGHTNTEVINIDHQLLGDQSFDTVQVAGSVMWHEATHTHSYRHTQSGLDCHDPSGYDPELDSAPSIVENCLFTAASGSQAQLYGRTITTLERLGPGRYYRNHSAYWGVGVPQGYRVTLCSERGTDPVRPSGAGICQTFATNKGTDRTVDAYNNNSGVGIDLAFAGTSYIAVEPRLIISNGPDWTGDKWALPEGTYGPLELGAMHDQIRSIFVPAGFTARMCTHASGTGGPCSWISDSLTTEAPLLGGISLLIVEGAASFYTGADFMGYRFDMRVGTTFSSSLPQGLYSVALAPGVVVQICSGENLTGYCQVFTESRSFITFPIGHPTRSMNVWRTYTVPPEFD